MQKLLLTKSIKLQKNPLFWLLLLCLSVVLAACGSEADSNSSQVLAAATATATPVKTITAPTLTKSPTMTATASASDWKRRWLQKIPCSAPCWEGITPGKTTVDEAVQILKQLPFVLLSSLHNTPPSHIQETGNVYWKWSDNTPQGFLTYTSQLPYTVDKIGPYSFEVKLGDVIKAYGNPTHVMAHTVASFGIGFYWFDKGFAVGVDEKPTGKEPVVDGSLVVGYITFFTPTTREQWVKNSIFKPDQFISWQGYKDFQFYCTQSRKIQKCLPPVINDPT
jgi:hypothetical protein